MKSIGEALEGLSEDELSRVLDWANSKYGDGIVESNPKKPVGGGRVDEKPLTKTKKRAAKKISGKAKVILKVLKDVNFHPKGKPSATDFAQEKQPPSLIQKCVVATYYMREICAISEISVSHVNTFFKAVKWKVPSDLPNTLSQAGSAGWLDTVDQEKIKITSTGENLVEHDLPKKQTSS